MGSTTRHISVRIQRPMPEVYDFAVDPLNLPRWASGLAGSEVVREGSQWVTDSPMGRVSFTFAPRNELGVLDHDVTLPNGQVVLNPVRAIPDGDECDVVFTLRRSPGMTDEEFETDAATVAADLAALKSVVEGR